MNSDFDMRLVPDKDAADGIEGPQRRRWDDEQHEAPALTLARYLARQPELESVARFLVALLCWPLAAQGAVIVRPNGHGDVEVMGEYLDQVPRWGRDPQAVRTAISDIAMASIGNHEVLWTTKGAAGLQPMAAWPLGLPTARVGVLVLFLSRYMEPKVVAERINGVIDVLTVYLAGDRSGAEPAAPSHTNGSRHAPHAVSLTARQLRILEYMAQDLTNRQIAARIGFSDSTVRAESMSIYRALGVRDRHQAVIAGRALRILVDDQADPAADPDAAAGLSTG